MVKDIEKSILSALTDQILNVIHDQYIHLHIEGHEVSQLVLDSGSIHELGLKPIGRYIKHYELRIFLLDGNTDCLGDMRLAQTRSSEKEERVECCLSRRS